MPWMRFDQAFDWKPQPNVTIAYLPGQTRLVTTACAKAAIAMGKGARIKKPLPERTNGTETDGRRTS